MERQLSVLSLPSFPINENHVNSYAQIPTFIQIIGNFQILKSLKSQFLCQYIDIIRGKNDQLFIVQEYHPLFINSLKHISLCDKYCIIKKAIYCILSSIQYLISQNILNPYISPNDLCLANDCVKLRNFGLFFMTNQGKLVTFPLGNIKYMAPETILLTPKYRNSANPYSILWGLGLILLEALFDTVLWERLSFKQQICRILSFIKISQVSALDAILLEHNLIEKFKVIPDDLSNILTLLVQPNATTFATDHIMNILNLLNYTTLNYNEEFIYSNWLSKHNTSQLKAYHSFIKQGKFDINPYQMNANNHPIDLRSHSQIYYLKKIFNNSNSSVEKEILEKGAIKRIVPIITLPYIIMRNGHIYGKKNISNTLFNSCDKESHTVLIDLEGLRQRLKEIDYKVWCPLLENHKFNNLSHYNSSFITKKSNSLFYDNQINAEELPLNIKEKDVIYQVKRLIIYDRLLTIYPYKVQELFVEAEVDICPYFRGLVWSVLLGIKSNTSQSYGDVDKSTYLPIDRQIEVDIPRCHQYNELLASPVGHQKFKNILKTWVLKHPNYVYWQGLDSLCAPFITLNFNDESLAYACFEAFVDKYLSNFFLRDNYIVVREYLAMFSALIAFQDPHLFMHMEKIGFSVELFAIPWFLTVFAHIFPLPKIYHLWDTILLNEPNYPLFVSLALLDTFKSSVLASGFNEAILLFSDLPDLDVDKCLASASAYYTYTPHSLTHRLSADGPPAGNALRASPTKAEIAQLGKYRPQINPKSSVHAQDNAHFTRQSYCPFLFQSELKALTGTAKVDFSYRTPTRDVWVSKLNFKYPQARHYHILDIRPAMVYRRDTFLSNFPSTNLPYFGCDGTQNSKGDDEIAVNVAFCAELQIFVEEIAVKSNSGTPITRGICNPLQIIAIYGGRNVDDAIQVYRHMLFTFKLRYLCVVIPDLS